MTVTVKSKTPLVVPQAIQRLAGIKAGDRLEVRASARAITITAVEKTYKPSKAEWTAIRRGEAALARGESVSLAEFAHEMVVAGGASLRSRLVSASEPRPRGSVASLQASTPAEERLKSVP